MQNIIKLFILFLVLSAVSCVEGDKKRSVEIKTPQEVEKEKKETVDYADAEFKDGMVGTVFQYYLQLRTALYYSDTKGAQTAASNLAESFTQKRHILKSTASEIAEANDLEMQRKYFAEFTDAFELLIKESISAGTVYKMYSPEALNNRGAYWLSDGSEINNPYLGQQESNSGSIQDTLIKK